MCADRFRRSGTLLLYVADGRNTIRLRLQRRGDSVARRAEPSPGDAPSYLLPASFVATRRRATQASFPIADASRHDHLHGPSGDDPRSGTLTPAEIS